MKNKLTPIQWSYLAGYMDADGGIRLVKNTVRVYIVSKEIEAVDLFKEWIPEFRIRQKQRIKGGERLYYELEIAKSKLCLEVLQNMLPYLTVKKVVALRLINFIESRHVA